MSEEIARLKVSVEGDKAALQSLTKIDQLIAKINGQKVNISFAQGMKEAEEASRKMVEASAKEIAAKAKLVKEENALAVAREKSYQEELKTQQAIEKTTQVEARQAAAAIQQTTSEQAKIKRGFELIGDQVMQFLTQNIRKATDELKAMNGEMVSIQKVTGATDAEMQRLKNSAFEVAGDLGAKPSDYLASVTKWAQAGYKGLSDQLGELSAKTQVVGDVNEETANKFLLAVDAAYKYKGNIDELTRVLDGANEISNNYATSVDKLANGMGIVSSLAEQAGMKVEETMAAIGTITAKTQESGSSAARALRALILNIQGSTEIEIDAETGERWTEEEIQRTAAALGKLNVATREYKDGVLSLRNPMEVIGELAEKYQKGLITEAQLQDVVASLGGKVRSNQLMALVQGYETYTDMIETYKDAVGSADNELQIYLNGWEAKSNKLVNQWTQFVESFKASDISMGILDAGNALLEFSNTNEWTTLISHVVTLTTAFTALNMVLSGSKLAAAAVAFFQNIAAAASAATGPVATFGAVVNASIGWVGVVVIGLTALVGIVDALANGATRAADALAEAESEYAQSTARLESLQTELKTTQDRIDELNGKDSLTILEQEELDKLKEQNAELEREIILQKELNDAKKAAMDAAAREKLNKGYSGADMSIFEAAFNPFFEDKKKLVLNEIQFMSMDKAAEHLKNNLEALNKQREEFLAQKPDASTWTDGEKKKLEDLDKRLNAYRDVAIGVRSEILSNAASLTDREQQEHWKDVGEGLWQAIAPAEAMTEKIHRLVEAMDEVEKTRFNQALKRIQDDGKVTAEEVQRLVDRFPTLKTLLTENGEGADRLAQYWTEMAETSQEAAEELEQVGDAAQQSEDAMEDLAQTLKTAANNMDELKSAQDELNKNGSLSAGTLTALLGKYGDALDEVLLKYMAGAATQEEVSEALQKAYQKEANTYREAILQKESDSEDFYSAWLENNADAVKKLSEQYGIDAANYKTLAQLKEAIEKAEQLAEIQILEAGKQERIQIFDEIRNRFADTQNAMLLKARETTGLISAFYRGLSGIFNGAQTIGKTIGTMKDSLAALGGYSEDPWQTVLDTINLNLESGKSGGKSGSSKSYYEQQTENLKKLEEITKRTNQVLEKSDQDTTQERIKNLKDLQAKALAMQKDFMARGKAETSDEVNQIKLIYAGLADDLRAVYSSMSNSLTEGHDALIWAFEKKANNSRSLEQIAEDDAKMVEQYRQMQQEVHHLADYSKTS